MRMAPKAEKRGKKEKSTNPIPHLANKYTDDKCCFFLSITMEGGMEGGLLCAATVDGQTDSDCIWGCDDVCQTVLSPYSTAR